MAEKISVDEVVEQEHLDLCKRQRTRIVDVFITASSNERESRFWNPLIKELRL